MTPEVSDPLFVPLTHVAVPVVNVAVRPLVASLPGIIEPPNIRSCPEPSSSVEFDKSMLEIGPLVVIAAARTLVAERNVFDTT